MLVSCHKSQVNPIKSQKNPYRLVNFWGECFQCQVRCDCRLAQDPLKGGEALLMWINNHLGECFLK